jgi:hypothetical protein
MSRKEYHHYYHGKNDSGGDNNNNNNGLGILALVFLFIIGLIFSVVVWIWNLVVTYWFIAIPVGLFILYCVGKYSDEDDSN